MNIHEDLASIVVLCMIIAGIWLWDAIADGIFDGPIFPLFDWDKSEQDIDRFMIRRQQAELPKQRTPVSPPPPPNAGEKWDQYCKRTGMVYDPLTRTISRPNSNVVFSEVEYVNWRRQPAP